MPNGTIERRNGRLCYVPRQSGRSEVPGRYLPPQFSTNQYGIPPRYGSFRHGGIDYHHHHPHNYDDIPVRGHHPQFPNSHALRHYSSGYGSPLHNFPYTPGGHGPQGLALHQYHQPAYPPQGYSSLGCDCVEHHIHRLQNNFVPDDSEEEVLRTYDLQGVRDSPPVNRTNHYSEEAPGSGRLSGGQNPVLRREPAPRNTSSRPVTSRPAVRETAAQVNSHRRVGRQAQTTTRQETPHQRAGRQTQGGESSEVASRLVIIGGQEVDIVALGIDMDYLQSLSADLREEVLLQRIQEQSRRDQGIADRSRRSRGGVPEEASSNLDIEFLQSLPQHLREEVLVAHVQEQSRRERDQEALAAETSSNVDPEFLQSLPADLRLEVLQQQNRNTAMTPPPRYEYPPSYVSPPNQATVEPEAVALVEPEVVASEEPNSQPILGRNEYSSLTQVELVREIEANPWDSSPTTVIRESFPEAEDLVGGIANIHLETASEAADAINGGMDTTPCESKGGATPQSTAPPPAQSTANPLVQTTAISSVQSNTQVQSTAARSIQSNPPAQSTVAAPAQSAARTARSNTTSPAQSTVHSKASPTLRPNVPSAQSTSQTAPLYITTHSPQSTNQPSLNPATTPPAKLTDTPPVKSAITAPAKSTATPSAVLPTESIATLPAQLTPVAMSTASLHARLAADAGLAALSASSTATPPTQVTPVAGSTAPLHVGLAAAGQAALSASPTATTPTPSTDTPPTHSPAQPHQSTTEPPESSTGPCDIPFLTTRTKKGKNKKGTKRG